MDEALKAELEKARLSYDLAAALAAKARKGLQTLEETERAELVVSGAQAPDMLIRKHT